MNAVDVTTLDPATRALADRGAREAFGRSLAALLDDFKVTGQTFEADDLATLVLAGRAAASLPADSRKPV